METIYSTVLQLKGDDFLIYDHLFHNFKLKS